MSFQAMAWASKQDPGDPLAKLLLYALANYADERGKSYPSIDRLARDTCMERKSIMRKMDLLIELGLVRKEQTKAKGLTFNEYHLIDQSLTGTGSPSQSRHKSLTGTCTSPSQGPNTINEPIKEPKAKAVWILRGSEEWKAWWKHRGHEPLVSHHKGAEGQWVTSQWPPSKEQVA
jgi:hypothetical protein